MHRACGVRRAGKRHPAFAETWVKGQQDPAAYEEYREKIQEALPTGILSLANWAADTIFCAKQRILDHSLHPGSRVEETEKHVTKVRLFPRTG